jgi:hypothetical protein
LGAGFFQLKPAPPSSPRPRLGLRAACPRGGPGQQAAPRVYAHYRFTDTIEDLPCFVSSNISKDKKNPFIIALHGLGGSPASLLRGILDLAERAETSE